MNESKMSVNGTGPSALRPYGGRKENTDTHAQRFESKILELGCVADTKRALRPASNQSVALLPKYADGELAASVADKPVTLRPAELSAIVVADNLSRSPVCSKPDGGEAIVLATTLRSLPKAVATHSSGVKVQSRDELVIGQGKYVAASGLTVDHCDNRLDPNALEFRPRELSAMQIDAREGVESTQVPPVKSADPLASSREGVTNDRCVSRQVNHLEGHKEGLFLRGCVEGKEVDFLIDTGADVTLISLNFLETLSKPLRVAFQDRSYALHLADGKTMMAKGPALCNITVGTRSVLELVYAAPITDRALMGLSTLSALGLKMAVGGVRVVPGKSSVRRITTACVRRVVANSDYEIPARSEVVLSARVIGQGPTGPVMIGPMSNDCERLCVARTVSEIREGLCTARVLNSSESPVKLKAGESLAMAEKVCIVTSKPDSSDNNQSQELPDHLKALFEETCQTEGLNEIVKEKLRGLLCKHAAVFARDDKDLGLTNMVTHDIETGDAKPIRQPPRRAPGTLQEDMDNEIQGMLDKGVIEPGQSPWASPVVLVKKKDGSLRFCVDYRRLNSVTEFDAYPLPRIDETLEALGGARFFSTLDLISGYWQVGLTPEARLKSAFCVRGGLFLWNVMPFGLCNAPSTFERLMETVLTGLQWKSCLVYLDDVVIFGRDEQELLDRMDEVFSRLKEAGLKLKPKKCKLFAKEISYLGHVISAGGIAVSPEKISAVSDWPVPETVTDVRSFLGTASYYRRFVKDFATIAAPLHSLTDQGKKFLWTADCQRAFDQLKGALCTTPVLKFPKPEAPFVLDTDASLTGIGAVLSQVIDGREYVLGYASRTLSKTERNYCTTRRELLAVKHFVQHFRPYLYGREFTIRTDHASLTWLLNFKDPEGQTARWIQSLSEYRFKIVHRAGKQHGNADGLSRRPCQNENKSCRQCELMERANNEKHVCLITMPPTWSNEDLSAKQKEDPTIKDVYQAVLEGVAPNSLMTTSWTATAKRLASDFERLKLCDGVLVRTWFNTRGQECSSQIILPRELVPEALQMAHDNNLSGHLGEKRTLQRLREKFFWPNMSVDVREWYRSCEICCTRKPKPTRPHHALQQDPVGEPLQRVALDIMGPLEPPTPHGNRYILVIVDYLTKWAEAYAMPNQTSETVAKILVNEFICRFGIPSQIHSDQGTQFEAALFKQMCHLLGMRKTRTTAFHPQSDGQTERQNRTVIDILAKLARENPSEWDEQLCYALSAYRSSVHSGTGETPNRLMLGREVATPITLLAGSPNEEQTVPWVVDLRHKFEDTYRLVVETTRAAQRSTKMYADRRQRGFNFDEGQLVWLYDPKPRRGVPHKLDANKWSGPWIVAKKISPCVYLILRRPGDRAGRVVNVDRLQPYVPRPGHLIPPEFNNDGLSIHENENNSEPEQYNNETVLLPAIQVSMRDIEDELEQNYLHAPVTTRPGRRARRPGWLNDYE